MNRILQLGAMSLVTIVGSSFARAEGVLVNGNFETGDLTGWVEMRPHYPGADSTVFDDTLAHDPMLTPYAGAYACGWTRGNGDYAWIGHDTTQPSNAISQTITNAPGTYPVTVSAAFYCHHNRRHHPEDRWGSGIWLRIFVDGDAYPVWQHDLWPREAESFWMYHRSLDNEVYDGAPNQITTTTGIIRFEIAWISKWTTDRDICAVDNVQLELGVPGGDPYDDPLQPEPAYVVPDRLCATDPGFAAGIFLEAAHYPVGLRPIGLAAGDLNGDDLPDIAVANYRSHSVSVLHGQGDGRFALADDIACGHNPRWIEIADVDLDERADLVVSCRGDGRIQTFLGDGVGGFSAPVETSAPESPECIDVGKLDGDGFPDLVIPTEIDNAAHVLLGNGDGSFSPHAVLSAGDLAYSAHVADFDRDRVNDLLVVSWWGEAHVFTGNNAGSFTLRTNFGTPWQTEAAAIADFDGDRNTDFAAAGLFVEFGDAVNFYLGRGDALFDQAPEGFGVKTPTGLCTGLWDADSLPDLAASVFNANELALWRTLNVWEDEVSPVAGYGSYAAGREPRTVVTDDFNGDGLPDFAVASGDDHEVVVLLRRPDGTWQGSTTHECRGTPAPSGSAAGDFDHDGDRDVAVGVGNSLRVLRNDGRPLLECLTDEQHDTSYTPTAIVAGDVDHDNDDDVFVAARYIRRYQCNGDMTFTYLGYLRAGTQVTDLELADLNGDSHLDIVCAGSGSDEVSVFLGDGTGSFGSEMTTAVGDRPEAVCVANFDNVAPPDLAVANAGDGTVIMQWGQGDGTFTGGGAIPVGDEPVDIACGHIDEDEHLDIVTADRGSSAVSVLPGRGDGTFRPIIPVMLHAPPTCLAVADFSGDGRDDIAVGLSAETTIVLLVPRSDGAFHREVFMAVGEPVRLEASPLWSVDRPDILCTPYGDVERIQVLTNAMLLEGRCTDIRREHPTEVTIEWVGSVDAVHVVESAPDATGSWTARSTVPSPDPLNTWTDTEASSRGRQRYRIRIER